MNSSARSTGRGIWWGVVVRALVVAGAVGFWLASESGLYFPYAPDGPRGMGWRWVFLPAYKGLPMLVLIPGVLVVGAMLILVWIRSAAAGRKLRAGAARAILFPGLLLALAEVGTREMEHEQQGQMAVYAQIAMLLCGRLCAGAMVWEAADLGALIRSLVRAPGRAPYAGLSALALVPLLLLHDVKIEPTGDEPSYIAYSVSMISDFNLRFTDSKTEALNAEMGLDLSNRPHMETEAGGLVHPGHLLGVSICLIPVVLIGRFLHSLVAVCHLFMLCVSGVTLVLIALLAMRLTRLRGPSIIAAGLIGISFPMLGMSYQIYPEPFVAMLVVAALVIMADSIAGRGPLPFRNVIQVLLICGALPWFHNKDGPLAAALALIAVVLHRPWSAKHLLAFAATAVGALVLFLAFNWPLYGSYLLNHPTIGNTMLYGICGMLVDSHFGIMPYAPWLVALPAGIALSWRRGGGWRYPACVAMLTASLILPTAQYCWEGRATAGRFVTPIIVLSAPWLAAAIAGLRRRGLFVLCAVVVIPLCAAAVFLNDPWTAYAPFFQNLRRVLDLAISAFSWRELFPHLRFVESGIDSPNSQRHALEFIGLCATVSVGLCCRRLGGWIPLVSGLVVVLAFGPVALSNDCPNWGVTASRMFAAQCRQFGLAQELRPRAVQKLIANNSKATSTSLVRLQLPAGVKPVEREFDAQPPNKPWFEIPLSLGEGSFADGPKLDLPRGVYRMGVWGSTNMTDESSTGRLELIISGFSEDKAPIFSANWPRDPNLARTPVGQAHVLLQGEFEVPKDGAHIDPSIYRIGNVDFNYDLFTLDYLGIKRQAR